MELCRMGPQTAIYLTDITTIPHNQKEEGREGGGYGLALTSNVPSPNPTTNVQTQNPAKDRYCTQGQKHMAPTP